MHSVPVLLYMHCCLCLLQLISTGSVSHMQLLSGCLSTVQLISTDPVSCLQLMRKNQYEEALFRAEDDRFELDMVIECVSSTLQRLQPLAEQLEAMPPEDKSNFRIPEGALGPIHYRSIQKIYGMRVTALMLAI